MRKYVLAAGIAAVTGLMGLSPVAQAQAPAGRAPRVTDVNLHRAYPARLGRAKRLRIAGVMYPLDRQPRPAARAEVGCTEPHCPLAYHGGPVQHSPHVYLLLWGPAWSNVPREKATAAYLEHFYAGLGVQPEDTWSTVLSQYGDGSGYPAFTGSVYMGVFKDHGIPPKGVTDDDLAAKAEAFAAKHRITDLGDAQIVIATQSGTWPECFNGVNCQPRDKPYCAWHAASINPQVPFTNLPYVLDAGTDCNENAVNTGKSGIHDGFSMAAGHEYAETITDPIPNGGWVDLGDGSGGEVADKCSGGHNPAGDVVLSTGRFAMESLWSNEANACVMSPPTVVAGIPAAFKLVIVSTQKCTWQVTGLPGSVTAGSGLTDDCTLLIDGVWPTPGTQQVTAKVTTDGVTTTYPVTVTVNASPGENDAVGVGSSTLDPLTDQLASGYNATVVSSTVPHEYSWDAVNPVTGQTQDTIPVKAGCQAIPRPDGSSAGIFGLAEFIKSTSGPYCINFARSARPRSATDPPYTSGGLAFVNLAQDAISYAFQPGGAVPASLGTADLNAIYSCTATGSLAAIQPYLPAPGSAVSSSFLKAIGVVTPGSCVTTDTSLQENEGVNPILQSPDVIVPYSIGFYIAQTEHSSKCLNTSCTPNASGVVCNHTPSTNYFGCDVHGTLALGAIDGALPTAGSGTKTTINPAFPAAYFRPLSTVVPYDPNTKDHIPGKESGATGGIDLEGIFGTRGFDCHSAAARAAIKNYGFLPSPACGATG